MVKQSTELGKEMETRILPYDLPCEPVDGHILSFYQVDATGDDLRLRRISLEYHVATPWARYSPDRGGGTDLVDTWMVSEDGCTTGRIPGWRRPVGNPFDRIYATFVEAVAAAVVYLNARIAAGERQTANIIKRRDEIKEVQPGASFPR